MAVTYTQPVFTLSPINAFSGMAIIPLNNSSFDPLSISNLSSQGMIHTSSYDEGNYVYRIRLIAMADTTNQAVTAKQVYVFIGNPGISKYALYRTLAMPEVAVSATVKPPELELYFPDGLLIPKSYGIYVAASTNYTITSRVGDGLYFNVEAGTYHS